MLRPELWAQVLQDLTTAFGAAASGVHIRRLVQPPRTTGKPAPVRRTGCSWFASSGLDPAYEKAYGEHYFALDPWAACVPHRLAPGTFVAGRQLVPHGELVRTEFYNDLCRPSDLGDWVGGIALYEPGECWIAIGMFGHLGGADFDAAALAGLQLLMPHLRRAFEVSRRTIALDSVAEAMSDALDRAPFGVIALDEAGRVIRTNSRAERVLSEQDGLSVNAGTLVTVEPRARGQLDAAIRRTLQGTLTALVTVEPLCVPRLRRARPLTVIVAPVQHSATELAAACTRCLVYIIDPETAVHPPEELLRRLFALTPAEVRLAMLVGQGLVPKEAACELGISWNTARYQLRQIFAKTGTDRQAALVRLMTGFGVLAQD